MLLRLLILLILIAGAVVFLRGARARMRDDDDRRRIDTPTVRCARCAVYFPRDEAIVVDGRSYCSRRHAEQDSA